jgi:CoA:oxalate CoA-transferase
MPILDNIRILDFSHVYFGPYATMLLGDLGADIIKIEPPWGEYARILPPFFGGISGVFHYLDRNKRGITLNLKDPRGKEIALALAEISDVVVENFSRGAMERLGLGYEDIRRVKPDIIYASLSGFGLTGPYAKRPSFASIASAMSGWYRLTGDMVERDGPPIRPAEWHGDLDPALFAVIGILSALMYRERTGEGQLVDVSQLDCMVAQNGVSITKHLMSGLLPWELDEKYLGLRFFGGFKASDGWVYIHTNPRMVNRLMEGMGIETLESKEELKEWVSQRTVQDVVDTLSATSVPVTPVYQLDQLMEDPQVKHREMIASFEHPKAGTVRSPNFPVKFSKSPTEIRIPAPTLGQHNEEILMELLGYNEERIDALKKDGVIT